MSLWLQDHNHLILNPDIIYNIIGLIHTKSNGHKCPNNVNNSRMFGVVTEKYKLEGTPC